MAGTTVNEHNVVYKTVQAAVNEEGFNFTLEQVLAVGAGKEKLQAIRSVLLLDGVRDEALAERIFAKFNSKLKEAYQTQPVTEQPHATALFHVLREKGIRVVLNTGYNRQTAEGLTEKIGWKQGRDIDALVTASDVTENRPNPAMILYAMEKLNIEDAGVVAKVGDSGIDIEEGRNAGCGLSIGITTGAHTREQLEAAGPAYIIDDLLELLPILQRS